MRRSRWVTTVGLVVALGACTSPDDPVWAAMMCRSSCAMAPDVEECVATSTSSVCKASRDGGGVGGAPARHEPPRHEQDLGWGLPNVVGVDAVPRVEDLGEEAVAGGGAGGKPDAHDEPQ